MSYMYDTAEPCVISEELLMQTVIAQGPVDEAGRVAKEEGIEFRDVTSLRLDFKNILRIDGLWEFVNLTKLQLDNNIIERIEGIDKLVNLVWLDLSFNNIEVIEGLQTLIKLQDLSLFNNHISRIENMDNLVSLQILSIGNNDLKELDNLIYLRKFKNLRSLNLSNNPFCQPSDDYKLYVAAYLPDLDFLDYRLLDKQTKEAGYEKHMIQIETMLDDEKRAKAKQDEADRKAEELEVHKRAYVEYLDGSQLFDSLYADDPDGRLLNQMPDIGDVVDIYPAKMKICQKIFQLGLEELKKRDEEVALFWECVEEAKQENKDEAQKYMTEFQLEKKKIFKELSMMTDPMLVEKTVSDYNTRVTDLWDKLMGLEMQLLDQLEEVIQTFELNMQDLVNNFIEHLQGFLAFAREAQSLHQERMLEVAHLTGDRMAKSELDDEISDELRLLFVDKDNVINALQSSNDTHLLKIDNREDLIVTRINIWMKNMMKTIHEEQEIKRNRDRVIEINHFIDHLREEVDNLEMMGGL